MRTLPLRVISLARQLLSDTRIGRMQWVADARARMFELTAPDLTRPVSFRGVSLYVDPADRGYVPSVVAGYYERLELDIFEALARDATVFFDVGANVGIYTVLGCLASETLVACAFEPVRENQELLTRNVSCHGLSDRVRISPTAASDRAGRATIHLGQSGNHSLEHDQGSGARDVDIITLDAFARSEMLAPDLIKIDVEGHESAVLAGAAEIISSHRPTVFVEFTPRAHRDVEAFLVRMQSGFETCFAVDSVGERVSEVAFARLDRKRDCNLILASRPEHIDAVRRFTAR